METNDVFILSSSNISGKSEISQDLLGKAKNGDQAAFGEIYNQFFKPIYRFVYFRVSHKEVAEDLTEEVFLKAYAKISTIKSNDAFAGWLYQIARNTVIDYYREKKIQVPLHEIENTLEYESNTVETLNLSQDQQLILSLLKELTPEQQIVIKLKFIEDLDNPTIAELLHKNEGAIRVIQHRALSKLQNLIKARLKNQNNGQH